MCRQLHVPQLNTHSYIALSYLHNLTRAANSAKYVTVVFRESLVLDHTAGKYFKSRNLPYNPASCPELFTNNEIRCRLGSQGLEAAFRTLNGQSLFPSPPSSGCLMSVCLSSRLVQGGAASGRSSDISDLQRDSMKKNHSVTDGPPLDLRAIAIL